MGWLPRVGSRARSPRMPLAMVAGEKSPTYPSEAGAQRDEQHTGRGRHGAARGIGAATAQRLATDGYAVAVVDLDKPLARAPSRRSRPPVGRRSPWGVMSPTPRRSRLRSRGSPPNSGPPSSRQQCRDHPRQPHLPDDRGRLGCGQRTSTSRGLPHDQGVPGVHDRREVRPDRQPLLVLGVGQPGSGQLFGGEGRLQGFTKTSRSSWASSG